MLIKKFFSKMDAAGDGTGGTGEAGGGAAPWYQGVTGIDQETIGHMQTKGWDKKTAAEAAVEAVKAFRQAEKHIGIPVDQILKIPKDATDEAGWNSVWQRLGKPQDAKGYDFSAVKNTDGTPLDETLANTIREQAYRLNLPKDAAVKLTDEFNKYNESRRIAQQSEASAKLAEERAALTKNWGANFEANKFVAQRAAAALGVDPATVTILEQQVGYSKVMEMFLNIGSKIGEDKFVRATGGEHSGVMSVQQAHARIAELKADKAWVGKYNDGDAQANREMTTLVKMISGA